MKHSPKDALTVLAMVLFAALAATLVFNVSDTVLNFCGNVGVLALVGLFCLSHGFISLAYLKLLAFGFPLKPGVHDMSDASSFVWKHQAVIRSTAEWVLRPFFPIFLRGVYYKILGVNLGQELAIAGEIDDAGLITLEDHVMIGHNAYVTAHAMVYGKLVLEPVRIGRGATIGIMAVVMPGVEVGEQAVVMPGAVVARGTRIGAGELWGGTPARKIKNLAVAGETALDPAQGRTLPVPIQER